MFSTSPGDVAMDGAGRNGIFTTALLKYINSDLKIEDLFKKVTGDVRDLSAGAQKPWINASLSSDFYFVSDATRAAHAAELAKAVDQARQVELAKATEAAALAARNAESLKTEQAKADAAAAKTALVAAKAAQAKAEADAKATAELVAALTAKNQAEQSKPKGKARFESTVAGNIYSGQELLGAVGPDSPLVADSLIPGKQDFRFVMQGQPDETKSAAIGEKAYVTVFFGKKLETKELAAPLTIPDFQIGDARSDSDRKKMYASILDKLKPMGLAELQQIDSNSINAKGLGFDDRRALYAELQKKDAATFMAINFIPLGVGSFVQGDYGYGIYEAVSQVAFVAIYGLISASGVKTVFDGATITTDTILPNIVMGLGYLNAAASYLGGFVAPGLFESSYNQALKKTLDY